MNLKPGVDARGIRPEILLAIVCACDVWRMSGYEVTITSLLDGLHGTMSKHYSGKAVDLRTRDLPDGAAGVLCDRLRMSLGSQYDVVLEDDHIHVEFDPKVKS